MQLNENIEKILAEHQTHLNSNYHFINMTEAGLTWSVFLDRGMLAWNPFGLVVICFL